MLNQSVQDQEALTAYLAAKLVDHGFDARVQADGDLEVGSNNRGPDAPVAIVHLDDLLPEYLASLASGGGVRGEVDPELAAGRLLTQLIESFDAVHDADDNNLTERVSLRRSTGGHVVLEEQRVAAGATTPRERDRHLRWSAHRP